MAHLIGVELESTTGTLTRARQVAFDGDPVVRNVSADASINEGFRALQAALDDLVSQGLLTGRNFERSNTDLTINADNAQTFDDRILLYAAGIHKVVRWELPTGPQITTSGAGFPYVFETIHLGGTLRFPPGDTANRVDIAVQSGDTARIVTSSGLSNLSSTSMLRGDRIIWVKASESSDWTAELLSHDSSTFVLPEGVAELRPETIQDVSQIGTELASLSINRGDMFVVDDSDGGTYFGREILKGDILLALVTSPDITISSDDFVVLDSSQSALPNDLMLLLRNLSRNGTRFDFNSNVFVDEANVMTFSSIASGTPAAALLYFTTSEASPTPVRSMTYPDQAIQFSALVGGTLTLSVQFNTSLSSGFPPELVDIEFTWGATTFTFPLTGLDPEGGVASVDINVPNADYSAILDTNCDITLNYEFRGAEFLGSFTIEALVNTLDGTLRAAVQGIANTAALMSEQRTNATLQQLAHEIDDDGSALEAIRPRISPFKTVTVQSPDINALFLNSTGSDSFPASLGSLGAVSSANPRFTGGDIALFVAVRAPGTHNLLNVTTSSSLALSDGEATVSLGESLNDGTNTYFVYRVTGLTSGHVYEVERVSSSEVVAWPDDIDNLQDDIDRIDAELQHAALNLPEAVVQVLENEVTVDEEATPVVVATDFNTGLGDTAAQTVFYEASPNTGSGGSLNSKPISDTSGDRAQRKLIYFPAGLSYINQAYLSAFDGAASQDLIRYLDGVFKAQVRVPAIPAGVRTDTIYPAPSNRVSGAGFWITIPALTFVNGVPVPEADEAFFTRNVPTASTTLTIQYRGHANGNVFGESTTSLDGVGGSSEVATSFVLNDGSETATVEVRWYPSNRDIRVSVTERVRTGLPTIDDIQVILSFSESRSVPETPETVREVDIEFEHPGGQVFAIKPSDNGNVVLVGDRQEVDTGFAYTSVFGASQNGFLVAQSENAAFLDYEDFDPIASTVTALENHASLPQFGLFTTQYSRETVLNLGVTLKPTGLNVNDLPTSATGLASGDVWFNGTALQFVP